MLKRRSFLKGLATLPLLAPLIARADESGLFSNRFRLAFGSCADQNFPQPIWDTIVDAHPDLFAFIGDNVYGDSDRPHIIMDQYLKLASKKTFSRFRSKIPIIATWDDHDYGFNDIGEEFAMKHESKKIMLDFFGEPADSQRRIQEGIYTSYFFGENGRKVQVILLDLRWFRSPLIMNFERAYIPNFDPAATMLGERQWSWLEDQLREPADVRILASSTQFVSEEHGWEKWGNFPLEKARLLQMLDQLKVRNLFVISGDMHFGELSMQSTPGGIPVIELTSSGLNRFDPISDETPNRYRLSIFDKAANFGLITIDWGTKKVLLEVRDEKGSTRIQHAVALD